MHKSFISIKLLQAVLPGKSIITGKVYENAIGYDRCAAYWGHEDASDMLNMSEGGLSLIKSELLERCGLEYDELVEVLQTSFMKGRTIITSYDGCSSIPQELEALRLRASVLVNANGALTESICSDLQSFIRLRHRLGWDTSTLDAALYSLSQSKPASFTGIDAGMVNGLATLKHLSELSNVPIIEICPLFGNIDRNGTQSLYSRLCKRSGFRLADDAFSLEAAEPISAKHSAVAALLGASATKLQIVLNSCGLDVSSPLTLETLSAMYRTQKLASMFGIEMKQYSSLVTLYSFDTRTAISSPSYVLASLKQWRMLQEAGFTLDLLCKFLGCDQTDLSNDSERLSQTMFAGIQSIVSQWPEVKVGNTYTEADVAAAAAAIDRERSTELIDYIEGKLSQRMASPVIVCTTVESSTTTVQRVPDTLREHLSIFRDAKQTKVTLRGLPDDQVKSSIVDLEMVKERKKPWKTTHLISTSCSEEDSDAADRVQQSVSGLDTVSVKSLLSEGSPNSLDRTTNSLLGFCAGGALVPPVNGGFQADVSALTRNIQRIEGILTQLDITPKELRVLLPCHKLESSFELDSIVMLVHYTKLRASLSPSQASACITLFESQTEANSNPTNAVKRIANATGWCFSTLNTIFNSRYPISADSEAETASRSPIKLLQIQRVLAACTKLDIMDAQINELFGYLNDIGTADKAFSFAELLREKVKARCSETPASALRSTQTGMNRLKERRRSALTDYLLMDDDLQLLRLASADDLYDYFLIDVKMGAEMETSRIRQAISTIQLFVQTCFLGIEEKYGVPAAAVRSLKSRWGTLGRFTTWEANRRVFLFPENWIDPTLRDTKTEPFKALEASILQGDLTEEFISNAIKSYVYTVQPIAHLDVQAYLWDKGDNDRARFHFFARTRTEPHQYFYRCLELEPFGKLELLPYWYPWTTLDIGTPPQAVDNTGEAQPKPGAYMIPTLVRGRIMLFVPEISLKSKPSEEFATQSITTMATMPLNTAQPTTKYWEIKMAWMELRDSKWSPRVVSPDSLVVEETAKDPLPAISAFRFRVRARSAMDTRTDLAAKFATGVDGILVLDIESWRKINNVIEPRYLGQFEMRGTELYRTQNLEPVFDQDLEPTTLPTRFSKLDWTVADRHTRQVPGQQFPSYELQYRKKESGSDTTKACMEQPLLVKIGEDPKDPQDLSWTLTFDDTQSSRPLGLLVDVKKASSGAQTFFARPRTKELENEGEDILSAVDVFPFHHTFSNNLLDAAVTEPSVAGIYRAISTREGDSNAFGLYADKLYHELFDAYSVYNWELGVHTVSLLMERLLARQQFDLALQVAHLLFDPTKNPDKPSNCWSFPPFRDIKAIKGQSIRSILTSLARKESKLSYTDVAIAEWKKNAFNAHSIARGRPAAYMRRVAQKYVETLIAAGDAYFRQATMESIPMAIQRYIEAAHVLGPRPVQVKSIGKRKPLTFNGLINKGKLDTFSNVAIDMELEFPYSCLQHGQGGNKSQPDSSKAKKGLLGFLATTYFYIPTNPQLTALWDLIGHRLSKLRSCQDINGMALRLPLFDPPIDPGMLVNAAAAGNAGVSTVMGELDSPLPNYRFIYLVGKAVDMVNQLSSLTDMFLSAKEKGDSEAFSQLKAHQESVMQALYREQKLLQKEEAEKSIAALRDLRQNHESRLTYYLRLIGEDPNTMIPDKDTQWTDIEQAISSPFKDDLRMSGEEKLEFEKSQEAAGLSFTATILDTTASTLMALPNLMTQTQPMGVGVSLKVDAENIAKCMGGMSTVMKLRAQMCEMEGGRASRRGGLIKQLQDRRAQANMAGREIKQVDKQIESALVRVRISEADIKAQQESIQQAAATEAWYKSKYTNAALYAWMENRTRALCFDAYGLAMDLARKAEKAFQFERGPHKAATSEFISSKGYWNNGHDGLLGAQTLLLDLRRMEAAYMECSPFDFQIQKNVSLRQISPLALMNLRMTGVAVFSVPESLYDLDFPGHYFRRLKSVAVSIPCVTGPYAGLNCTLSLLEHSYRISPLASSGDYIRRESDDRFRTDRIPVSSIALSQRSADSGVFELNFNSERYLPFENAGAISTWKLELPQHVRQFSYETISDVILHLKYTSRQGGAQLRTSAVDAVSRLMAAADGVSESDGLFALIDVASDFANAWALAQSQAQTGQAGDLLVSMGDIGVVLPYWSVGYAVKIQSVTLISRCSSEVGASFSVDLLYGKNNERSFGDNASRNDGWDVREISNLDADVANWGLRLKRKNQGGDLKLASVKTMYLIMQYTRTQQLPRV
ncbi:unnamed protein product [Fusarium fujikuroi]|uniref:Uncharacterized protein n=1 Tax=Fusarium fujikuroi TaxID=5127 RepID=A0A9Q9RVH7_FUSFU|nr:unnamed protein product [Fusarium fujikuroi]